MSVLLVAYARVVAAAISCDKQSMKFLSVRHAVPATVLSNEDMIARLTAANQTLCPERLAALTAEVRAFLDLVGTKTRHTTNGTEAAVDILRIAVARALDAAETDASELDFIIYAGVNRGWLEPSSAALVQREFGAAKAVCFDVSEACASWVRAVQVADALLKAGTYRLGLIVNCECDLNHLATYELGTVSNHEDFLAAFTVGEAATATVVAASEADDLYITMRSYGEYCDLCMIPLVNAGSYLKSYDGALHPPGRFY